MLYLILPSLDSRQALISHLLEREILAVFHYLSLHLSAMAPARWARRRLRGHGANCRLSGELTFVYRHDGI